MLSFICIQPFLSDTDREVTESKPDQSGLVGHALPKSTATRLSSKAKNTEYGVLAYSAPDLVSGIVSSDSYQAQCRSGALLVRAGEVGDFQPDHI